MFFADDAEENKPRRPGMGPLVGIGGVHVPGDKIRLLETEIDRICVEEFGFPPGEPFKWSPSSDLWMHSNLKGNNRRDFFVRVLGLARQQGARATVVILDKNCVPPAGPTHEQSVAKMMLERVNHRFADAHTTGVIVIAEPRGGPKDQRKFLRDCMETFHTGTEYVQMKHLAITALTTPFPHVRQLQLADVVTSCSMAFVAGKTKYSAQVFPLVRDLLATSYGVRGGRGLKLYTDKYTNLYYWLLGDESFVRYQSGYPLPFPYGAYAEGPDSP